MSKNYSFLILALVIFFISQPDESFCKKPDSNQSIDDESVSLSGSSKDKVLSIRLKRNISLYELITKSGHSIEDKDVVSFLTDFTKLNWNVKSISILKKGTVIKLPLKNLKKVGDNLFQPYKKPKVAAITREKTKAAAITRKRLYLFPITQKRPKPAPRTIDRKPKEKAGIRVSRIDKAMLLRNIKILSDSLDDKISIETEGFKFFNINERTRISLDTSFFPVIVLNKERILVLDYSGILPQEIKDIVELAWPEYRVVSNNGRVDLKNIIGTLLESMDYSVNYDKKIVVGGRTQIEYFADFLIFKKQSDMMDSKISVIGIIKADEYTTPESLVRWLKEKDINLIELTYNEKKKIRRSKAEIINIDSDKNAREFTETMLSLIGYKFSRDDVLNLSDRKEYSFNLKADLSINLGYRTKVIEFVELSDYEINYAKKRGFDIACIRTWDARKNIISKLMALFSLNYNSLKTSTSHIMPRGVKYRLLLPGVFVHSVKGPVLITDADFEPELLRQLIDEKVNIITF